MSNTTIVTTTSDPLIITINLIQLWIGRSLYPLIFAFGDFGTILNILVLTRRVYLQNSCPRYMLASCIMNLMIINIIVVFRILSLGFNIDLTTTSSFFCKFRFYIAHVTTLLSRLYIVLACIDRWAMSSKNVRYRAFSQKKIANIMIVTVGIIMCIISVHVILYNDVVRGRCAMITTTYIVFYNIYNPILSGLLIPIIMIIFGFLTIKNIRQSRQRVNVQMLSTYRGVANQQADKINIKSREYQISIMILVQLGFYLITCLPFPIYLLYSAATMYSVKGSVQTTIEGFASNIVNTLLYINFSATFYIYVLTTRVFRKELKALISKNNLFRKLLHIQQDSLVTRIDNPYPMRAVGTEMT